MGDLLLRLIYFGATNPGVQLVVFTPVRFAAYTVAKAAVSKAFDFTVYRVGGGIARGLYWGAWHLGSMFRERVVPPDQCSGQCPGQPTPQFVVTQSYTVSYSAPSPVFTERPRPETPIFFIGGTPLVSPTPVASQALSPPVISPVPPMSLEDSSPPKFFESTEQARRRVLQRTDNYRNLWIEEIEDDTNGNANEDVGSDAGSDSGRSVSPEAAVSEAPSEVSQVSQVSQTSLTSMFSWVSVGSILRGREDVLELEDLENLLEDTTLENRRPRSDSFFFPED